MLDMLTGQGNLVHHIHQAQISHKADYQQVSDPASKALKACPLWEPSAYFYNLIQQPGEIFTDFLTSVNEAVEQRVDLGQ